MATKKTKKTKKTDKAKKAGDPCNDDALLKSTVAEMYSEITGAIVKASKKAVKSGVCLRCFTAMIMAALDEARNDAIDQLSDYFVINLNRATHRIEELEKEAKHADADENRK